MSNVTDKLVTEGDKWVNKRTFFGLNKEENKEKENMILQLIQERDYEKQKYNNLFQGFQVLTTHMVHDLGDIKVCISDMNVQGNNVDKKTNAINKLNELTNKLKQTNSSNIQTIPMLK